MMNVGIFNIGEFFVQNGISQSSILSPLLFNIYMTEFDEFVISLMRASLKGKIYNEDKRRRAYTDMISEFSTSRLGILLKKSGSIEGVRSELCARKKEYYEKYRKSKYAGSLQYVRYVNDLIIGIVGSRELVSDIQQKISVFIKSNLHLDIIRNRLFNGKDTPIIFLGFLIKFVNCFNSSKVNCNTSVSIAKYKRRVLCRFKHSNARLAKAVSFRIKKNLILALQVELGNKPFNNQEIKNSTKRLAKKFKDFVLVENPALAR